MVARDEGAVGFVSYSRADAEWRRRFVTMLAPVVRERGLGGWSDDRMLVGEAWRPQLEEAIGRSYAALVLVSPDSLASEFIMGEEVPALQARGARLVCALVRPCLWQHVAALQELQWAHDPRRDGPVASSGDPEGQIVRVCEQLLELLPAEPTAAAPLGDGGAVAGVDALARGRVRGRLDGVPALPAGYIAREELDGLRQALLAGAEGALAITGNARALGLHGQGGIGKTVLAAALAHDDELRRYFPDGGFWVTVGERGELVTAQIDLLARLGVAHAELRSASEGRRLLERALRERQCLLVVDDVWTRAAAEGFRVTGARGRVLYTTRDPAVLPAGTEVEHIEVLSERAARELLAQLAGMPVHTLPAAVERVLGRTGRTALALALVGAAVGRGGRTWEDVAAQLERGARTFLEHPYANTFKAMQVAVATLDPALADAYRSLAVYPEDTLVPIAAVARHWRHLWRLPTNTVIERLRLLADHKLLTLEPDAFRFMTSSATFCCSTSMTSPSATTIS